MSHPTCCSVSLDRCDQCDLLVDLEGFPLVAAAQREYALVLDIDSCDRCAGCPGCGVNRSKSRARGGGGERLGRGLGAPGDPGSFVGSVDGHEPEPGVGHRGGRDDRAPGNGNFRPPPRLTRPLTHTRVTPVKIDSMTSVFAGISASILALAPITNPIGALAAFAGLTAGNTPAAIRSQAWKTGIYVFAILTTFTVCGSFIMRFFGFDLPSLQIAGGLVVAHSGFSMLENKRRSTNEEDQHATLKEDVSFSPMALPLIAGPGSIGVVIALAARNTAVGFQIGIVLGILITAATIAVLLRYGTPWIDKLGATGVGAITRIMGFLILVIGVELVIHGIRALQLF